jgi:hypothetical protein
MTRRQLEQLRECVKAQMRWALAHGGDQELLDLLRIGSDRLFLTIEAMSQSPDCPADHEPVCEALGVTPSSFGGHPASRQVTLLSDA